jgi:hypothetical protein
MNHDHLVRLTKVSKFQTLKILETERHKKYLFFSRFYGFLQAEEFNS